MTRHRWHLSDPGREVILDNGSEAYHYFSKVVRVRSGEEAVFFCGDGKDYVYRLADADRERLRFVFDRREPATTDPGFPFEIWIPNLKGGAVEDVIRNVVPLGITTIRIYSSERTVSKPSESRSDRRQKTADEAVRQCGRTVPAIVFGDTRPFGELVEGIGEKIGIVFHEKSDRDLSEVIFGLGVTEKGVLDSAGLVVVTGPEGGFTDEEIDGAVSGGITVCRLGRTVLRAELAPVVAAAVVQYGLEATLRR